MKTIRMKTVLTIFVMVVFAMTGFAQEEGSNSLNGGSKYGSDSAKCVENLSLYKDFYNQWKSSKYSNNELAEDAYKSWSYCIWNCPTSSINMYQHGIDLISKFKIKNAKDSVIADK